MDYNQIHNCPSGHTRTEQENKDNQGRFIKFKNDYGNFDVVYIVDFDYNKVKK